MFWNKKKFKVTRKSGGTIMVDTSEKACLKFGFKHGDRIIDPDGDKGIIIGVAPSCGCTLCIKKGTARKDALWYALDILNGKVVHWGVANDLRVEGFVLESKTQQ